MPILLNRTRRIYPETLMKDIKQAFPQAKVKRGLFGNINIVMDLDSLVVLKLSGSHAKICGTQPLLYGLLNGSDAYGYQNDKKRKAEKSFAAWLKETYDGAFV